MALRLDDLNDVNGDLVAATKRLLQLAEEIGDSVLADKLLDEVDKLSDLSRRLSLATRSVAHVTLSLLEAS